ncbi:lytic murein transglycosylase [Nesterenkonia sp.]|uniref:lytic transglycosylase domain-containing protein n=1 Tax=Nesterenkonia sp. TaxID=704201 RepID=UPI0026084F66|nr:lytic murein transglycosylase [Nesterenkonia sp.]
MLIRGCAAGEPEEPHPTELGYPPAPEQHQPEEVPDAEQLVGQVPTAELVDPQWVADTAERTRIPERAVAAYAGAAVHTAQTNPDCGLGWNTLAGIGRVESVHGAHGGSSINEDGVVDPPVIGVALDGSQGVMEIPDTDGGELDGDEEWDRAVGPMQFIPTTWNSYAQDADLTGEADIHQYDDAALTAAAYLCARGGDLTDDRGWVDAVSAYNQSVSYAQDAARHAEDYGQQ